MSLKTSSNHKNLRKSRWHSATEICKYAFPGATIQCMADYMKPSIRAKPDHVILHVGTNDLNSNATPNEIAANIVGLATEMKTENCDVSISGIIIRTDTPVLNEKGLEVNVILKELCMVKNIFFIDHCKKIKAIHLNSSKLHLNKKGDSILSNIFAQHISKICNWELSGNISSCNLFESSYKENESNVLNQDKKS